MDKKKVAIISISVGTTFIITFGTALGAVMAETHTMPTQVAWLAAGIGALVQAARTVQEYLKGITEKEQAVAQTKTEMQAQNK